MGGMLSHMDLSSSAEDDLIATSLKPSELIYRHTLSTCYDSIFDVSLTPNKNLVLISDDGRLRLFNLDVSNGVQFTEVTTFSIKLFNHEQVHDIIWCDELTRFLILTSKRLSTFDDENNLVNLNLQLEKGSPPFWRMACWSSHLVLNFGLGTSIRYYKLESVSSISLIHSFTRTALGYTNSDLLSSIALSPQLVLAVNVELSNNRHVVDLYSIKEKTTFQLLKRIDSNEPCSLDMIASLRNCTWLCKSHWPSDDCLCVIESNGQVNKVNLQIQDGYVLNVRLLADRTHFIIIRTPSKLPKEIDIDDLNKIDKSEEETSIHGNRRTVTGKLPGNLLLEIYKIPSAIK